MCLGFRVLCFGFGVEWMLFILDAMGKFRMCVLDQVPFRPGLILRTWYKFLSLRSGVTVEIQNGFLAFQPFLRFLMMATVSDETIM